MKLLFNLKGNIEIDTWLKYSWGLLIQLVRFSLIFSLQKSRILFNGVSQSDLFSSQLCMNVSSRAKPLEKWWAHARCTVKSTLINKYINFRSLISCKGVSSSNSVKPPFAHLGRPTWPAQVSVLLFFTGVDLHAPSMVCKREEVFYFSRWSDCIVQSLKPLLTLLKGWELTPL